MKSKMFLVATCAVACTALAHDSNSVAFYAFKEGSDGESAVGKAVLNDVSSATHSGTVSIISSETVTGEVVYSDDAPGKYVFAGKGGALLCANPQSLHFVGDLGLNNTAPNAGGNVSFENLGTVLSGLDEWTVEFFWKANSDEYPGNTTNYRGIKWNAGLVCTNSTYPAGAPAPIGINMPESKSAMRIWAGDDGANVNWYTSSLIYTLSDTNWGSDETLLDGLWHHVAVTYVKSSGLVRGKADYCVPDHRWRLERQFICTNVTLTASEPLDLGCFRYRGRFACLRVSSKALSESEYMYVSNDPNFYPDNGDTVLHFRMEGGNGVALSDGSTSISNTVKSYREINTNIFYGTDTAIVSVNRHGCGVAYADANAAPTWTNAVPNTKKTMVTDGEGDTASALGETTGSLRLEPAAVYNSSGWMKSTPGFYVPYDAYSVVTSGSFTCECFMRFDCTGWLERNQVAYYPRFGIMGMPSESYEFDWKLYVDFVNASTSDKPDADTNFRFKLQAYVVTNGVRVLCGKSVEKSGGSSPCDDAWHHCAVVYDDTALQFTTYVDYSEVLRFSVPTNFTIIEREAKRNLRFGYGLNDQNFMGEFDEIRLSRVALEPSQMLHLRNPAKGLVLICR